MKYNAQGMRIQKDEATYMTNYFYNSQNRLSGIDVHGTILYFYYDADGNVTAFNHNGGMYYYVKNVQGDIIRIINEGGTTLVTYTYDAWGNIIKQTDATNYNLANVNPFKYRSYVYDYETGLYYLNSRYYDPTTGRFLDADIYCDTMSSVLGTNMFTYCNNNPVNQIDPNGTDAMWLQFPDGANGFGHTSLLLQDATGTWWYFYWGPKHIILHPCGKEKFSLPEFNSYMLNGFDSRRGHNYYVYSYNGPDGDKNLYDDKTNRYIKGNDINADVVLATKNTNYYYKMYDGLAEKSLYMHGNFQNSYNWLVSVMWDVYNATLGSDKFATQMFDDYYENAKRKFAYHICRKVSASLYYVDKNSKKTLVRTFEYYEDLKTAKFLNYGGYNVIFSNCVQMCIFALLEGEFNSFNISKKALLDLCIIETAPNAIYNSIWYLFDEEKMSNYL